MHPLPAEQSWLFSSRKEEVLLLPVHSGTTNQSCSHRAEGRAPGKRMMNVCNRVRVLEKGFDFALRSLP